jgi:hypothetical protein
MNDQKFLLICKTGSDSRTALLYAASSSSFSKAPVLDGILPSPVDWNQELPNLKKMKRN